jgi:hypothetical protein
VVDPIEQRNSEIHRRVAGALRQDPSLAGRAMAKLERTIANEGSPTDPVLLEWRDVLLMLRPHELAEFLESNSPRARRLRISSPFFGLVT